MQDKKVASEEDECDGLQTEKYQWVGNQGLTK